MRAEEHEQFLSKGLKSQGSAEAAPLLCAGVTTYNALRNAGLHAGDLIAFQGIGGLGHLGVQFARKMGFRTGADRKLGTTTMTGRFAA